MKYVLEFGKVGGYNKDNIVLPTRKLAEEMAASLSGLFFGDSGSRRWMFCKGEVRKSLSNGVHFVAISKLDGKDRGSASALLWGIKEPENPGNIVTTAEWQERAA